MNILHLTTLADVGAGSAAYRLHLALKRAGHNSKIIAMRGNPNNDNDIILVDLNKNQLSELEREKAMLERYRQMENDNGKMFFFPMTIFYNHASNIIEKMPFQPDLIIAHWTTELADVRTFYKLYRKYHVPVIWYMTDMEPMTGGCHYAFECKRFYNGCYNCPALKKPVKYYAHLNWLEKKLFSRMMKLNIVASSSFMLQQASLSGCFDKLKKYKVYRGIDNNIFKPHANREELRIKNGVNNKFVIFFGAQSVKDKRKGGIYLLRAFRELYSQLEGQDEIRKNIVVLVVGNDHLIGELTTFPAICLPFKKTQEELASLYQMSDLYVCPTIQDSGPMMVSESLMCGTPVVGFKTGILPDVVIEGKTGYLAEIGDVNGLANAILNILNKSSAEKQKMSNNCIKFALKYLTYEHQTEQIMKIHRRTLLKSKK